MKFSWYLTMAWRDSRRSQARLFFFTSAIVLGIAALTAVNAFRDSLFIEIENEAKSLLGADLLVASNRKLDSLGDSLLQNLGEKKATEINFASMIYFPKNQGTRLIQVRALQGAYPFYGKIETYPAQAAQDFQQKQSALVDKTVLIQFDAQIGDSISIGEVKFRIEGELLKAPGQTGITATVAPVVYIPQKFVDKTGLLGKGSRVNYVFYYVFDTQQIITDKLKSIENFAKEWGLRTETVADRKKNVGEVFENFSLYLNLVGFVALLLGCVGVASAVQIYLKEKIGSVAILRCLGASNQDAFMIYLVQIFMMGFLGSILGSVLGMAFQYYMPTLFASFLPMQATPYFSWSIMFLHVLLGSVLSLLFALLPLLGIRRVSPLLVLRVSEQNSSADRLSYVVYGLIGLFMWAFAYQQFGAVKEASFFILGVLVAFGLLALLAKALVFSVRKFFPHQWSFVLRQGLSNLYRPNNQTLTLMVSIGLGTALLTTLLLLQSFLLGEITIQNDGQQPNMMLFDVQTSQKEKLKNLLESNQMPVLEDVPVITMRLLSIKGKSRADIKKDSTLQIPDWIIDREYRVTYRDTLTAAETLEDGKMPIYEPQKPIPISIESDFAQNMKVKVGDQIEFDVQGVKLTTQVAALRKVNWRKMQSNFLVIFPTGVLEQAPQFHILLTKAADKSVSAQIQRKLIQDFPNVSVIDLNIILQTLGEILDKIAFVIRFMAAFSVLTGFLVLLGSVYVSKYQRIRESVLLRTLGASTGQVLWITWTEYFVLGVLAALTGIILAFGASFLLAFFVLKIDFVMDWQGVLLIFLGVSIFTSLLGMYNIKSVLGKSPLEVLRNEV